MGKLLWTQGVAAQYQVDTSYPEQGYTGIQVLKWHKGCLEGVLFNPKYRQCRGQTMRPTSKQVPILFHHLIPSSQGGQGKVILKQQQVLLCGGVTEYPGGW